MSQSSTDFSNELPVGFRLEEFEIKSVLGSGGFGITYLALDVDLKRDVVVKENLPFQCAMRDSTRSIRPRTSAIGDTNQFAWALESFMREAETLSRFDHPNIVRILRRFQANNTAYFVMPYLPGESLKQVIEKQVAAQEAFTEPKLKELLNPLLDALQTLHYEGVYHRDIKAANIMLVKGHKPILIDFGAARLVISEKSHTIVESAGFTPFEQLQSRGNVGPWSDIYALAATFYTAIHGEPPPRASDRIRRDPIVKLADSYADVYSKSFLEALDWALCVEETERPQSVVEWREALNGGAVTKRAAPPDLPTLKKFDPSRDVTIVQKKDFSPPEKPKKEPAPPKPKEPFPVKLVAMVIGGLAGAAVVVALMMHVLHPLFAKPGSLHVTSNPPQATVHIDGQKDLVTPADFPQLKPGKYQVAVTIPGYDPVAQNVEIKDGAAVSLPTVQLKRAFGDLVLLTLPARASYRLLELDDPNAKEMRGTTPATLSTLPSGPYQLIINAQNLGSHTINFDLPAHQLTRHTEDLIKLNLCQDDKSPAARALLGQMPIAQLDSNGKAQYADLLTRAINAYLRYNMFPQASAATDAMQQAGRDPGDMNQKIAAMRDSFEKSTSDQIDNWIDDHRYGSALSKIKAISEMLGKEAADRLTAKFQAQLATYQQQSGDALQQAQQGDPAAAYAQLKSFTDKYPDDVRLQLALGRLLTQMPPDHDRLGARVAAYKSFNAQYLGMEESGQFQEMQAKLQGELATYEDLAAKANKSKSGPAALSRRIASLQDQIEENQHRLQTGEGIDKAANAVTGIFGQHVRITSGDDRRAAIAREQSQLNEAQAELQNYQSDNPAAQSDLDAFTAKVPW